MRRKYNRQQTKTAWNRIIAWLLAVSMVLIPVQFPNEAVAAENEGISVPNMFTDNFSDDRHTDGLTYKWNNQGGTNTYYSVGNGYFTLGMPYSEEEGGAYNTISILSAQGKDSVTGSSKNYAGEWENYTAQMKFSKVPVGTSVTYSNGTVKTTTALNTVKLLTRVNLTDNGYEYYYLQITGGAGNSTGTLSLQRYYYDEDQGKFVSEILANFGAKTMTEGTWHTMKVKLDGNEITVWYDDVKLGTVTDSSEYAIACGSIGLSSQGRGGLQHIDDVLVTFPNDETAFYDSFADERFFTGTTYQWNPSAEVFYQWEEKLANANCYAQISADGTYQIFPQRSSMVYLSATSFDPATGSTGESGAFWTNYTVEGDVKRNNTETSNGAYLLGRVQYDAKHNGYSYYALKVHSSSIYLIKRYYDTAQSTWIETPYGSVSGTAGVGNWGHAKMTFKGGVITISLTYDKDGVKTTVSKDFDDTNGTYEASVNDDGTSYWTTETHTTCAPFMYGGIGLRGDYNDNTTEDNAEFDNIKVTLENGAVVFCEDFSAYTAGTDTYKSEGYFAGVLEEYDPNKVQPWDVTWTLEEAFSGGTAEITEDGTYKFYADGAGMLAVKGTLIHPSDSSKNKDASAMLTDYKVEFDYVRHNMQNATTQGKGAPWFVYNMSEDSNTYPYLGNTLKLHSNSVYMFNQYRFSKYYAYQSAADRSPDGYKLTEVAASASAGNWRHAKLEISGLQYTMTVTDLNGNIIGSGTYTAKENNPGFFGFMFEYNSADTAVDAEKGYEPSYEIDNLKVTLPNGKVAFEETFTLAEGETKDTYMAATRTVEDVYYPEPVKDWNVADGAYTFSGSGYMGINTISVLNGKNDCAKDWADYAVESDFMLSEDNAAAGFVARYNGIGSYYQMVLTASRVGLYKVSGSTVTELAAKEITIEKDTWQYAKLTVNGTTLEGNLNGEIVVTADISADTAAYTAGTSGLVAVSAVKFDNVACFAPEMAESRVFNSFDFNVDGVEELENWDLNAAESGSWEVAEKQLIYKDDTTAKGIALLKAKTKVKAASVVMEGKTVANGSFAVFGRYSNAGYYKLEVDTTKGLTLYKSVNGTETVMASLSLKEAYAKGIRVEPDSVYTLKLQMVDNTIAGFVNDYCVFPCTDANPLPAGVSGVEATGGSAFSYLEIATLSDVVKSLSIVKSIDHGVNKTNATYTDWNDVVEVPIGGTPDIKNLYLKVLYYDDSVGYVALDTVELSDFDVTTAGDKQVTVTYGQGQTTLAYKVIDRTTAINNLNAYLAEVNASTLTLNDQSEIESYIQLYNDLSPVEKALVSEENRAKLAAVRTALEDLIAPEVTGSEVVFVDEYDTVMSEELYENHNSKTGTRNSGYWYVDDGKFVQYSSSDEFRSSTYYPSTIVDGGYWNVKSVSADMRIIDQGAWVGMHANFTDSGSYRYTVMITDKVMSHNTQEYTTNGTVKSAQAYTGTRVDLYKNTTLVYRVVLTGEDAVQTGQWYNLKMTMVDGKVRVYLDNEKVIEWNEISDVTVGAVNTEGTVGLLNSEGWGEFDNFIVRGTEADSGEEDITVTLEPGEYTDNFDDETENIGKDPSHWIEATMEDKWTVIENEDGLAYGSNGATVGTTKTWLHVFETDVDYTADIKITKYGYYPIFGMVARDNTTNSYVRAGYDATFQKWFIKVRLGEDFEETVVYSDTTAELAEGDTVKLRLLAEGRNLSLYVDDATEPVVTGDAGRKVMPGRVGVYTERCDVTIDNVNLQLLSGQGRVNDGVWEYYASETGITTSLHQILELPDGRILLYSEGNHWVSDDGGKTFERTSEFSQLYANSVVKLPEGLTFEVPGLGTVNTDEGVYVGISNYMPDRDNYPSWSSYRAYLYTNNLQTKTALGIMPTAEKMYYAQPGDHMNLVKLDNGTYRLFYTAGRQSGLEEGRAVISETYYSDDFGQTWYRSANTPQDFTNLKNWCETKIIKITKDVIDFSGKTIPAGTIIQYCSYNTSEFMRYSLSYDGGVTWEGDYVMPTIPTCLGSFSVEEDRYNPGTYYMSTIYNYPYTIGNGRPRHRIALLRSTDGFNWEYLADIDRWGDVSDGGRAEIMQNVNMYLDITEDYIFPGFSRSDAYEKNSSGHNKQLGRVYRFEKSKLEAYDEWPAEYYISPKTILYIEGAEEQVQINSEYPAADATFTVHYYDGSKEEVLLSEAYYTAVDTSVLGEKEITLDFGLFRDVYTINVVSGEAPVISGVEDGKTYCGAQEVTVTDANGDLDSVTLNGTAVTLTDGKFTVSAAEGEQTIVATDKADNATTIKVTVNAAHSYTNYTSVGGDLERASCDHGCGSTDTRVVENHSGDQVEVVPEANETTDTTANVTIDTGLLNDIAGNDQKLYLKSDILDLIFDNTTLQKIVTDHAGKTSVSVVVKNTTPAEATEKLVFDIHLVVDGEEQESSDFGEGIVTVTIPLGNLNLTAKQTVEVWYVKDGVRQNQMTSQYDCENCKVEFQTSHFSEYEVVVVDETTSETAVYIENKTDGAATVSAPTSGTVGSAYTITVTCDKACVVLAKDADGNYTRLPANGSGNTYSFTVELAEGMQFVVAVKGDANGDGQINNKDITMVKRLANLTEWSSFDLCVMDVSGSDSSISNRDITVIKRASNGTAIEW